MTLPTSIPVALGDSGVEVTLRGDRSIYWSGEEALLVADVHLAKEAVFQARGVPLPPGGLTDTLSRLTKALDETNARRLIILGDLIHHRDGLRGEAAAEITAWLESTAAEVHLIAGNHDRGAEPWLRDRGVTITTGSLATGGLLLHHGDAPATNATARSGTDEPHLYALAGHLHPTVRLQAFGDRLRLPCFCLDPEAGLLPAFTEFSNGPALRPRAGRRLIAVADGALLDVRFAN